MKGAAEFCLGWLVTDRNGNLITSPSTSPENQYKLADGFVGATLYGGTADLAMIRECFDKTIKASKVLNTDTDFRKKLETALSKLHPYQIGKKEICRNGISIGKIMIQNTVINRIYLDFSLVIILHL